MPIPGATYTITLDAAALDAIKAHTEALNRWCDLHTAAPQHVPEPQPNPDYGTPWNPATPYEVTCEDAEPQAAAARETAPPVSMEQLMRAGADLISRGVDATQALREFGVNMVSELPENKYAAFADRLRQMGGNL